MLTYALLFAFFSLVAMLVYKEDVLSRWNMMRVALIIFGGSAIMYITATFFISKYYPWKRVVYDVKYAFEVVTDISDTTHVEAHIGFEAGNDHGYIKIRDSYFNPESVAIKFLADGDDDPYYIITQEERQIDSYLWAVPWGVPWQNRVRSIYIPDDSLHCAIVKMIWNKEIESDEEIN